MRNQHIERLEIKLKLWDTPGFHQFLGDLAQYSGEESPVWNNIHALYAIYKKELQELKEKQAIFKQGKLEI